jgi:hypothetical protein
MRGGGGQCVASDCQLSVLRRAGCTLVRSFARPSTLRTTHRDHDNGAPLSPVCLLRRWAVGLPGDDSADNLCKVKRSQHCRCVGALMATQVSAFDTIGGGGGRIQKLLL